MASTVESIGFADQGTTSGVPVNYQFHISQFPRAKLLAENFKMYRPVKVTWTYEALYNNYSAVTGATNTTPVFQPGPTVPQLYWKIDKAGQYPFQSLAQMQDAGCKPFPLSRKKVVSYVPARRGVNIDPSWDPTATENPGYDPINTIYAKAAPWSATHTEFHSPPGPSVPAIAEVNHEWYGHQMIIDQALTTAASPAILTRCVCTVHWQFKDPYIHNEEQQEVAAPVIAKPKRSTPAPLTTPAPLNDTDEDLGGGVGVA